MHAYSNKDRAQSETALPDVEIFYDRGFHPLNGPGYYYTFCFPGCLPDSEPVGPFDSPEDALEDAQEG